MLYRISFFCIFILFEPFNVWAADLYVYWPTDFRPRIIQNAFKEECKGLKVLAFARSKDFYLKVAKDKPSAVISFVGVIKKINYEVYKKGINSYSKTEELVLVSFDHPIDFTKQKKVKIAALDIFGRKETKKFLEKALKTKISYRRVVKIEDLMAIMQRNRANGIILSKTHLKKIKSLTKRKLVETKIGISMSLATVGINKNKSNHQDLAYCLKVLSFKSKALMGVKKWL